MQLPNIYMTKIKLIILTKYFILREINNIKFETELEIIKRNDD